MRTHDAGAKWCIGEWIMWDSSKMPVICVNHLVLWCDLEFLPIWKNFWWFERTVTECKQSDPLLSEGAKNGRLKINSSNSILTPHYRFCCLFCDLLWFCILLMFRSVAKELVYMIECSRAYSLRKSGEIEQNGLVFFVGCKWTLAMDIRTGDYFECDSFRSRAR